MGNDTSQLNGLEINQKAIEISDFWYHHQAFVREGFHQFSVVGDGSLSIFKGQNVVLGPLWATTSPIEKCSNNLLKYRHPCILRYISAWQQRSTYFLATEFAQPLSLVLASQSPLQMCVGLNNILEALVFLHEQALLSHNNVSVGAIYVTGDGQWRLGGMQYLRPIAEVTPTYLKHARIHRYDKAVDPQEEVAEVASKVDHYAFAALVDDVFKGTGDDLVPHLKEFKQYCRQCLQNPDPALRHSFGRVLKHDFFNHEFISIYKFLCRLPLKDPEEKAVFFTTLLDKLRLFSEETVAVQLGGHLLSRLVLLDSTARKELLPSLLTPRSENVSPTSADPPGLFTLATFREHIKPRLMQMMRVRDAPVRLLLLAHLHRHLHAFTHDDLAHHVLPELLLGIKDTDDTLVAATLRCLSELVPILGAGTVIGGHRSKIFTDGRPTQLTLAKKKHSIKSNNQISVETPKTPLENHTTFIENSFDSIKNLKDFHCSEASMQGSCESLPIVDNVRLLERPSPVGGESDDGDQKQSILEDSIKDNDHDSEENWSDWDATEHKKHNTLRPTDDDATKIIDHKIDTKDNVSASVLVEEVPVDNTKGFYIKQAALIAKSKKLLDISELDIKTQTVDLCKKKVADEFDFFADMTPVIEKTHVVAVKETISGNLNSKFSFNPELTQNSESAWGEEWDED